MDETKVTQHLDKDPNDPRAFEPTPDLPSLNDPGQSGEEALQKPGKKVADKSAE